MWKLGLRDEKRVCPNKSSAYFSSSYRKGRRRDWDGAAWVKGGEKLDGLWESPGTHMWSPRTAPPMGNLDPSNAFPWLLCLAPLSQCALQLKWVPDAGRKFLCSPKLGLHPKTCCGYFKSCLLSDVCSLTIAHLILTKRSCQVLHRGNRGHQISTTFCQVNKSTSTHIQPRMSFLSLVLWGEVSPSYLTGTVSVLCEASPSLLCTVSPTQPFMGCFLPTLEGAGGFHTFISMPLYPIPSCSYCPLSIFNYSGKYLLIVSVTIIFVFSFFTYSSIHWNLTPPPPHYTMKLLLPGSFTTCLY